MRPNATSRPPLSHTAALTLMLSCLAFARAPCTTRLASSSVRAIDLLPRSEERPVGSFSYLEPAAAVAHRGADLDVELFGLCQGALHDAVGFFECQGHRSSPPIGRASCGELFLSGAGRRCRTPRR